jgi:hypothetical protein
MISLDARDLMESKGIKPTEHNKTFDTQMLSHKVDKKDDDGDGLTDVEMLDDQERKVRDDKSKKLKEFEAVPESTRLDVMADALSLVQISDSDNWYDSKDFVQIASGDVIDDLNKDEDAAPSISEMAKS